MKIRMIELYKLKLPLIRPYHTALGVFNHFDSILAVIRSDDDVAVGESTPALGYSWEGPEGVWEFIKFYSSRLIGLEISDADSLIRRYSETIPFSTVPLITALEQLNKQCLPLEKEIDYPLVGILNVDSYEEIPDTIDHLLEQGYTTIKVKIGFSGVDKDIKKIRLIQNYIRGRASIRLDANQSYTFEEAMKLVKSIEAENIELLEQPFPSDHWEEMKQFASSCPLPLMLDESIYGVRAIEKVINYKCANNIKLKLMKSGSFSSLRREATLALNNGIDVIVGNGLATDISCYQETKTAFEIGLSKAGEMNGFLKLCEPLLPNAIRFYKGKVKLHPTSSLAPDATLLSKYGKKETFGN